MLTLVLGPIRRSDGIVGVDGPVEERGTDSRLTSLVDLRSGLVTCFNYD